MTIKKNICIRECYDMPIKLGSQHLHPSECYSKQLVSMKNDVLSYYDGVMASSQ